MATVRILFCIICLVVIGWCGMSGSDMLIGGWFGKSRGPLEEVFPFEAELRRGEGASGKLFGIEVEAGAEARVGTKPEDGLGTRPEIGLGANPIATGRHSPLRYWLGDKLYMRHVGFSSVAGNSPWSSAGRRLVELAQGELWVREGTGKNDGERVEGYLASVGLKKGQPWCAAFVSFIFKEAGYAAPRTGWSPSLFPSKRLVKAAAPGNVFGIYFPALKRIAHCGFVERSDEDWISSIEGNTGPGGGREGDGVHRRKRHKRTIYKYADWR